jgi:hypothetical protein
MQYRPGADYQFGIAGKCAGRQVSEREWSTPDVDLVARVWSPDTDKEIIFGAQVRGDLSLAFAAVLTTNKHVNQAQRFSSEAVQLTGYANQNILWCTPISPNHNIRDLPQSVNPAFSLVFQDPLVGR